MTRRRRACRPSSPSTPRVCIRRSVAVPAFLAIELSVQNGFASPITVRLEGAEPFRVTSATRPRSCGWQGRRPGRYVIDFGTRRTQASAASREPSRDP